MSRALDHLPPPSVPATGPPAISSVMMILRDIRLSFDKIVSISCMRVSSINLQVHQYWFSGFEITRVLKWGYFSYIMISGRVIIISIHYLLFVCPYCGGMMVALIGIVLLANAVLYIIRIQLLRTLFVIMKLCELRPDLSYH